MRVEQFFLPTAEIQLDRPPPPRDACTEDAAPPNEPGVAPGADDPIFYAAPPVNWPRLFPGL